MTASAFPAPLPSAADGGGMPGTAEELADLAELRGLAMAAARRCAAAQSSAETPEQIAVLTLALDRAARAVRHVIVLEQQCRGARPLPQARGMGAHGSAGPHGAAGAGGAQANPYGAPNIRHSGDGTWGDASSWSAPGDTGLEGLLRNGFYDKLQRLAYDSAVYEADQAVRRGEPVVDAYIAPCIKNHFQTRYLHDGPPAPYREEAGPNATPGAAPQATQQAPQQATAHAPSASSSHGSGAPGSGTAAPAPPPPQGHGTGPPPRHGPAQISPNWRA